MATLHIDSEIAASESEPERWLCYEEADVVIALDGDTDEDLLLHKQVLSKASPFFAVGMTDKWDQNAEDTKSREVTHPKTQLLIRIYRYGLSFKYGDSVVVLDTDVNNLNAAGGKLRADDFHVQARDFYTSSKADGFMVRDADDITQDLSRVWRNSEL
jgi:hypothetical protein